MKRNNPPPSLYAIVPIRLDPSTLDVPFHERRNNHWKCSVKKGVCRKFTKFTAKNRIVLCIIKMKRNNLTPPILVRDRTYSALPLNLDVPFHEHRINHWKCSVKKGVCRKFTKFTAKHPCQSLFFKVSGSIRAK